MTKSFLYYMHNSKFVYFMRACKRKNTINYSTNVSPYPLILLLSGFVLVLPIFVQFFQDTTNILTFSV